MLFITIYLMVCVLLLTSFYWRCFIVAVISHLSTGDHVVEEEIFQSTLRYIFTFIEKVYFDLCSLYTSDDDGPIFTGETSGEHR